MFINIITGWFPATRFLSNPIFTRFYGFEITIFLIIMEGSIWKACWETNGQISAEDLLTYVLLVALGYITVYMSKILDFP